MIIWYENEIHCVTNLIFFKCILFTRLIAILSINTGCKKNRIQLKNTDFINDKNLLRNGEDICTIIFC